MTNKANITARVRTHADKIEPLVDVTNDGTLIDSEFLAKTLPSHLSPKIVDDVLNYVGDTREALDVVVAEKACELATKHDDFTEARASVKLNDRWSFTSRWQREEKDGEGNVTRRGRMTSKLTVKSSEDHSSNMNALEELAASLYANK